MSYSKITETFKKGDDTYFGGALVAYIPNLVLDDGVVVPAHRLEFPLVSGVPKKDATGADPAKLPVTVDAVPANSIIELRLKPVNGNEAPWRKVIIPDEVDGAAVNLSTLTDQT